MSCVVFDFSAKYKVGKGVVFTIEHLGSWTYFRLSLNPWAPLQAQMKIFDIFTV